MRFSVKRDCEKSRILSLHFRDSCNEEILWIITLSGLPTNNNFLLPCTEKIFFPRWRWPYLQNSQKNVQLVAVFLDAWYVVHKHPLKIENIGLKTSILTYKFYTCTYRVLDRKKTLTDVMILLLCYRIILKSVDMIETRQFTVGWWLTVFPPPFFYHF